MDDPPSSGYFILARVENKKLLDGVINHYLEKSITFTVSKNPHQLVTKAAKEHPMEAYSANSNERIFTEEDFKRGGTGILDEVSEEVLQHEQQNDINQEAPSTSSAEPVVLQSTRSTARKRKADEQLSDLKTLEPQTSKFRATPVSPAPPVASPPSPPAVDKHEEEGVNAADLMDEDEEPVLEVPTTSAAGMNPYTKLAVIPNCTSNNGARIVRIVRSSDLEAKNIDGAPSPNPQDEVICNLRITEAVDWVAKNDCDLAILMIKEGYLPSSKLCPRCNNRIHPYFQNFRLEWRCMYVDCTGVSMSLFANTWFSYLNLPVKQIMKIIILWSQSNSADAIRMQLGITLKAVWIVENRIRETCIRIVNSYEPLGGNAIEVQMGLVHIGTKKFHQVSGRSTKMNKQVLIGAEPRTGRCFLHIITARKPISAALARWIRPGSIINGCMYESEGDNDFIGKLDLWNVDGSRPFVIDAYNQLAPSDLGDVIGETLPGYMAEMVVRLNEKENTMKKLMGWLRYWMQPQPGPNGQTMPVDLLSYCPAPIREDMARLGQDGEKRRMSDGEEMEKPLFDEVKREKAENGCM